MSADTPPNLDRPQAMRQLGVTPEAFTTLDHFSTSEAMRLPKSSGVPGMGLPPSSARRSFIFGSASARFTSAFTFSMTARGVPLGMPSPNHAEAS